MKGNICDTKPGGIKRFLEHGDYGRRRYEFIAGFFSGTGKLLDVGCCKGDLRNYLPQGIEYYGVDSDSNNFQNFTKHDLNSKRLPYADKTFDMINCSAVLEHLFYPYEILSELFRVLKDNGILLVSLPNDRGLNGIFGVLFGKIHSYDRSVSSHHWRFSIDTAREFVRKKFNIINERPAFGPFYEKYLPFLRFRIFSTEWFMVCKKKNRQIEGRKP